VDSMRTPPKIHRFYRESMDFGWTMISFGKIYPCRSVGLSKIMICIQYVMIILNYYDYNTTHRVF
jgi:hypothetical protein